MALHDRCEEASHQLLDGPFRKCLEFWIVFFNPWLLWYEQPAVAPEELQLTERKKNGHSKGHV